MEVAHFHAFGVDGEGVGAILVGLEVEGHLALGIGIDYGVIHIVLRDIELRAVAPYLEFGQLMAFADADDGAVDDSGRCALILSKGRNAASVGVAEV